MPLITGPQLDEMVERLRDWYVSTRKRLIETLEQGYPYGSIKLSPTEQLQRFLRMDRNQWDELISRLMERHRGEPNQQDLVNQDLQRYIQRMTRLMYGGR